jgi:hypothetical protein
MEEQPIIPSDAVRAIQDSAKVEIINVDGRDFTTRQVFSPPKLAEPAALLINTLTGIVDYFRDERTVGDKIHVVNHAEVRVVSGLYDRFKQRDTFVVAKADDVLGHGFLFGHFYEIETFNIALQSLFVETPVRSSLLSLVGNIKTEKVINASDDGVTQAVIAKQGIARVTEAEAPNPVSLMPYRTFRELDQPKSPFILRLREGREGGLPLAALFEADGGQWKLEAIQSIRDYLKEELPDATIIA